MTVAKLNEWVKRFGNPSSCWHDVGAQHCCAPTEPAPPPQFSGISDQKLISPFY